MVILAALGGVDVDAALVLGVLGDKFHIAGLEALRRAGDADRARLLAAQLGGFLGNGGRAGHAAAGLVGVVVFAGLGGPIGGGVQASRRADADRAGGLLAVVLGDLAGHAGYGHALVDIRTGADAVVIQAGGRAVHIGRSVQRRAGRVGQGSGGGLRVDGGEARAADGRRLGGGGFGVRAAAHVVHGDVRAFLAAVAGQVQRRRGGGGSQCQRRILRGILSAAKDGGEDQNQRHDEPDGRGRGDADADGLLKLALVPQQIDAQRREQEQQQVGHPVVLIDILHERAGFGRVVIAAFAGVLVGIAIVVFAFRLVIVPAGIAVVIAVAVVIALIVVIPVVTVVVVPGVVITVVVVLVAGIIVVAGVVGVAVIIVVLAVVIAVTITGVGVVGIAGIVVIIAVIGIAVPALVVAFFVEGGIVFFYICVRLLFAAEEPLDFAIAPAIVEAVLRKLEFQLSNRVRCHNSTTLFRGCPGLPGSHNKQGCV